MVEAVREIPQVVDVLRSGNLLTLESKASDDIRPGGLVSREIIGHDGIIISMNTRERGLEDVFVKLAAALITLIPVCAILLLVDIAG